MTFATILLIMKQELAKYPSSQRDLALVTKKELPVGKLLEQVKK